ncbi:MAG: hypothetical protein JO242_03840 [Streptosporangiaceae bacterium]|nr:hypothetical protein [Streptosporangiaceae bacterium]
MTRMVLRRLTRTRSRSSVSSRAAGSRRMPASSATVRADRPTLRAATSSLSHCS